MKSSFIYWCVERPGLYFLGVIGASVCGAFIKFSDGAPTRTEWIASAAVLFSWYAACAIIIGGYSLVMNVLQFRREVRNIGRQGTLYFHYRDEGQLDCMSGSAAGSTGRMRDNALDRIDRKNSRAMLFIILVHGGFGVGAYILFQAALDPDVPRWEALLGVLFIMFGFFEYYHIRG